MRPIMATKAIYILQCTNLIENTVCWRFEGSVLGITDHRPGDVIRFGPNRLLFNTDVGLRGM